MTIKKIQVKDYLRRLEAGDPTLQDFAVGPSPGGAAAELGISRQAVHLAIKRGDLDAMGCFRDGRLMFYNVGLASLRRYKAHLQARRKASA